MGKKITGPCGSVIGKFHCISLTQKLKTQGTLLIKMFAVNNMQYIVLSRLRINDNLKRKLEKNI
jgi:hypothetical protein